jgi:hypothetical protein
LANSVTIGKGNNATTTITLTLQSTAGISQGMAVNAGAASVIPPGTTVANTANVILVAPATQQVTIALSSAATVNSGQSITFQGYWSTAHPGGNANPQGSFAPPPNCTSNTASRQSVYQYEIDNKLTNNSLTNGAVGGPTCSKLTPDPNRRFLDTAVLNCLNLEAEGSKLKGNSTNLPVAAFAKFFLTQPVNSPSGPIYAEYGGIETPGSSNSHSLFYQVQLYR